MTTVFHAAATKATGIHEVVAFSYPTEADRLAGTNRTPLLDTKGGALPLRVGHLVDQTDTGQVFLCTGLSPLTWREFRGVWTAQNGLFTATFSNETIERTLYTLTIPANTLRAGDVLRAALAYDYRSAGAGAGDITTRIRVGGAVAAQAEISSDGASLLGGFADLALLLGDTGAGPSALRAVSRDPAVDATIDATAAIVVTFTVQWGTADPSNFSAGIGARLSVG